MKGYILNDYERSISIKNLKSIIGTPMYKKLAAGTLRFGASNNGKGERLVLVDSIPLKYMSQEARAAILFLFGENGSARNMREEQERSPGLS